MSSPGLPATAPVHDLTPTRPHGALWRQPVLLLGTAAAVAAALTMTAGPILGLCAGRTPGQAALAIQLHLVGMFAPGFVVGADHRPPGRAAGRRTRLRADPPRRARRGRRRRAAPPT